MKAIATIIFIIFIGVTARAHDNQQQVKIASVETGITTQVVLAKEVKMNENSIARLYKFKNTPVKKALSFTTKRNKAKLA